MENDIIDMLIYDNYDELQSKFNIPRFEANMLCQMYKKMNYQKTRGVLIDRIRDGFYSREEEIRNSLKTLIKNKILRSSDKGKSFLMNNCGLTELEAYNYTNSFVALNDALKQSLSIELDTSSVENQMNTILENISNSYFNNEGKMSLK